MAIILLTNYVNCIQSVLLKRRSNSNKPLSNNKSLILSSLFRYLFFVFSSGLSSLMNKASGLSWWSESETIID